MKDTIKDIAIGSGGIIATEGVEPVIDVLTSTPTNDWIDAIIKIIIAIGTLFGIFKDKRKKRVNKNERRRK